MQFGQRRSSAILKYVTFVHDRTRAQSVRTQLRGQLYLRSAAFTKHARVDRKKPGLSEIPPAQRCAVDQALDLFAKRHSRDEAMTRAYSVGAVRHGGDCPVFWRTLFERPVHCGGLAMKA